MVVYEKVSRAVLGLGQRDPAFIARGEQNFAWFAAVLDKSLRGHQWSIADFSVGWLVPSIKRMQLPIGQISEIGCWYDTLARLPAWHWSWRTGTFRRSMMTHRR